MNRFGRNKGKRAASDKDVSRRINLLIDCDPVRLKDTSATDAEKAEAFALAVAIRAFLTSLGWSEPILCDSGNGYHLLFKIDLPNDDESRDLVKAVLLALAARFNRPGVVEVDCRVFNASRVTKLYGITARKGESTVERPHRVARVLKGPEKRSVVSVELLRALVAEGRPAKEDTLSFDLGTEIEPKRGQAGGSTNGQAEAGDSPAEPPPGVDPGRKAILDAFSDDDLLTWARNAKNGGKFTRLYDRGDASGYESASEADCVLLVLLAFWTGGDAARMQRLFDASALGKREKWTRRPDYRADRLPKRFR